MPIPQNILDTMQRLKEMTLENGCTPAEAANAAARLHKLLADHQLSIADLNASELGEGMSREDLKRDDGTRWTRALKDYADEIARAFGARLVYTPWTLSFLGTDSDVTVARFFFETTWPAVRNAGRREGRARGYSHAQLIAFYEQFTTAAGVAIGSRLRKMNRQAEAADDRTAALVPLKRQRVDEFVVKECPALKDDYYTWKPRNGADEGFRFGQRMDLNRPIAAASPPPLELE